MLGLKPAPTAPPPTHARGSTPPHPPPAAPRPTAPRHPPPPPPPRRPRLRARKPLNLTAPPPPVCARGLLGARPHGVQEARVSPPPRSRPPRARKAEARAVGLVGTTLTW